MPRRERRPPEVQKVFNHLNAANRELVKGVTRFMDQCHRGPEPLPGHMAEMRRRLLSVRAEAEHAIQVFEGKGKEGKDSDV